MTSSEIFVWWRLLPNAGLLRVESDIRGVCRPHQERALSWSRKSGQDERLWKSIKYEEVYLRAYETVGDARNSIGRYLDFYNGRRPHSSLDDRTPDQAYFDLPPLRAAA